MAGSPTLQGELQIIIRGQPNTGKTTIANLIREFLVEGGFQDVHVHDLPPTENKPSWWDRFQRNQTRRITIRVERLP